MTTLPLRAPHVSSTNVSVPVFGKFFSGVALFLDVMIEAQQMAEAAHKRYPFAAW